MAYSPPAEDTIIVVGGLGTQADRAALNGGGATKDAWDANTPGDFIDTNGGPVQAEDNCTYTHATTQITKAASGLGTNVAVGTIAYVSDGGGDITSGRYKVTAIIDADTIEVSGIDATGNSVGDVTCNIGGAIDSIETADGDDIMDAGSYNRYIYTNLDEVDVFIEVPANGGSVSLNTWYEVIGYDSTLTAELDDDEYVEYTYTGATDGFKVKVSNVRFQHLWWNGSGHGEDIGSFTANTAVYNLVIEHCKGTNGWEAGVNASDSDAKSVYVVGGEYEITLANANTFIGSSGTLYVLVGVFFNSTRWGCCYSGEIHASHCIVCDSPYALLSIGRSLVVKNCTFYDISVDILFANSATCGISYYNNIFDLSDPDADILLWRFAGSICYEDYNITNKGADVSVANRNDVVSASDADIGFLDPTNGDFSLKEDSVCLGTGRPYNLDAGQEGPVNKGAWQRKSFLRHKVQV